MQRLFCLAPLFVLAGLCSVGCTAEHPWQTWARHGGGIVVDAHQTRAQAAITRLCGGFQTRPTVYVLNSSDLCAHAWPDGAVFVTRGLVDTADDDELCAAIAHELGHLINDGRLTQVASLRGNCRVPDCEAQADATGVRVLKSRRIDPLAMGRLLEKVRNDPGNSPSCRRALAHRVALLAEDQN